LNGWKDTQRRKTEGPMRDQLLGQGMKGKVALEYADRRLRQELEGEVLIEEGNHFLFSRNQFQDLRGNLQRLLLQSNLLAVTVAQVEDLLNRCIFLSPHPPKKNLSWGELVLTDTGWGTVQIGSSI
jgi:hypothetical protein